MEIRPLIMIDIRVVPPTICHSHESHGAVVVIGVAKGVLVNGI